jgi:endonuclease/exonuclease/phosphatase (EEP) superfamily protein YafD
MHRESTLTLPPRTLLPSQSNSFPSTARPTSAAPRGAVVLQRRGLTQRGLAWWIRTLTWTNLAALGFVFLLLCVVSERWWFSAVLGYLPRQLYALPAIGLLIASLLVWRRSAWVNALGLVLVLGPIMGLSVPVGGVTVPTAGRTVLRIASGNLQQGEGSVPKLLGEIKRFQPDLIVLQEANQGSEQLLAAYGEWEQAHLREFLVVSRFPLRVIDHCRSPAFDRWSAMAVEVVTPDGPVLVGDVHLMTPRHGADGLTVLSPLTGAGVEEFEWHQRLREEEAATTRAFFAGLGDQPLLLMGDFNAPTTSSLFAEQWSGFQSAFETAGWGYGYTSPCNTSRLWLENTPWMRIDHLLADDRWQIHSCRIGTTNGSDHRLLFSEVSLR